MHIFHRNACVAERPLQAKQSTKFAFHEETILHFLVHEQVAWLKILITRRKHLSLATQKEQTKLANNFKLYIICTSSTDKTRPESKPRPTREDKSLFPQHCLEILKTSCPSKTCYAHTAPTGVNRHTNTPKRKPSREKTRASDSLFVSVLYRAEGGI